ncbi:hypothetical protein STEG23_035028, partial [Scotinomys teguina]
KAHIVCLSDLVASKAWFRDGILVRPKGSTSVPTVQPLEFFGLKVTRHNVMFPVELTMWSTEMPTHLKVLNGNITTYIVDDFSPHTYEELCHTL